MSFSKFWMAKLVALIRLPEELRLRSKPYRVRVSLDWANCGSQVSQSWISPLLPFGIFPPERVVCWVLAMIMLLDSILHADGIAEVG